MKRILTSVLASLLASASIAATNLVSNTAIVTNRVQGIVTYTMSNGVARVQDPSGKLVGTAEERALKVAAEGQVDIASAAADAAGTAIEEWREFTATTDVNVVYIDAGFTQDLPALAPNLCGWVAGSFYDREKGEDHYYVWFNREMDAPPSMCARIVSESGTNWLDGAWVDWAVTNWIDKATGREADAPPTASDYVQDGLVAMFDGIENAGWGVHDGELDGWKNLVVDSSDYDASRSFDSRAVAPTWTDDAFYNNGTALRTLAAPNPLYGLNACTLEFVVKPGGLPAHFLMIRDEAVLSASIQLGVTSSGSYGMPHTSNFPWNNITPVSFDGSRGFTATISSELLNGRDYHVWYANGAKKTYGDLGGGNQSRIIGASDTRIVFGSYLPCNNSTKYTLNGWIYCTRLYNRPLTAEEVAANYTIDRARFFKDNPPVPCRELVVPRRNANCVLKTGTVITLGGKDGFDADIHKVNIEVNGTPTPTTSAQLPLFYTVTRSGTNTVTRAYTNGFLNVENGFVKEPTNE